MKNKSTVILLMVTLVFAFLTIGFWIGRNLHKSDIIISYDHGTAATAAQTPSNVVISGKLNINTATLEDLCELPGIGEITAQKIIQYREEYGNFSQTSDIMKVSGIGEKTFYSISDLITIGG